MENKKLFIISFLVNFIFSMLTTLLSLIVFNINNSPTDINFIMTTFICALLITRLVLFKQFLKARLEIIIGSTFFSIACLLLVLNSRHMILMFFGSLLFGIAIGMIPPAILSILSDGEDKDRKLGIYNAIVAVASIFSPKIGEKTYHIQPQFLFSIWLLLSIFMTLLAFHLKKRKIIETSNSNKTTVSNLKAVLRNRKFQIYFFILLFSSLSYGSIVSYLPIYFEEIHLSIGLYYFFFWFGYIVVQFFNNVIYLFKTILLALLFIIFGQLSLMFFQSAILIYTSSLIYGLGYGILFKLFYIGIGYFDNPEERTIGFSIIGLISYLGVGIAPIFFIPFNGQGWNFLFLGHLIYSILALLLFILLWRKKSDDSI